tara:strand:- start:12541 stop:12756 length:216 start_codon:yes stop_codon:yes gene_type:complete
MKITINGVQKEYIFKEKLITMTELINHLNYDPRLIVVEYNGVILASNYWETQEIKNGDALEIVTIVGGGLV